MNELVALPLLVAGAIFYVAGTVGMLRFVDVYSRLHALTKADNLGLGLLVIGLVVHGGLDRVALKMLLVWVLVLGASTVACNLVAAASLRAGAPAAQEEERR